MENAKENVDALRQIKSMGVKLSMDDFGTGYSSLSYLRQFPLDELKIDRSFVSVIQAETDDAPIVAAIIAMAHSLGLTVVTEGVETEQQLMFLRQRGCDEYQGYLCSKPVDMDGFAALLPRTRRAV
jgi:EAL domain-containing protein (putative c-di-GMP-specific phosphodiesterase class I)